MTHTPIILPSRRSGFTLLEIIIVLVVIATIFGGSFLLLSSSSDDKVHTIPSEIENLVKTSLEKSKRLKQTHYLHISKSAVWLSTRADDVKAAVDNAQQVSLPDESTISYRPLAEDQWTTVRNNQEIVHLAFSVSGICEPFSLRVELGESYAECDFHPLTGSLIQP